MGKTITATFKAATQKMKTPYAQILKVETFHGHVKRKLDQIKYMIYMCATINN